MNLDLYQDDEGWFHYVAYEVGVTNARRDALTLCGLSPEGMRSAAWFKLGDPRGAGHYERGCHNCRQLLIEEE